MAKTVTHYRLTFWPHQGVPRDTKTLTDFLRCVQWGASEYGTLDVSILELSAVEDSEAILVEAIYNTTRKPIL